MLTPHQLQCGQTARDRTDGSYELQGDIALAEQRIRSIRSRSVVMERKPLISPHILQVRLATRKKNEINSFPSDENSRANRPVSGGREPDLDIQLVFCPAVRRKKDYVNGPGLYDRD